MPKAKRKPPVLRLWGVYSEKDITLCDRVFVHQLDAEQCAKRLNFVDRVQSYKPVRVELRMAEPKQRKVEKKGGQP